MSVPGGRWLGLLAGFVAGLAGGLFGVGGGILLVPLLTGMFGLTQHQAHGTSLAAIGATAIAGLVVYASGGHVAWLTGALMAVTSVVAARFGARLAARMSHAGLIAGFMGVGGGIIAVPALVLLFGMPQQTAQGTSLALILVTAPVGAIEHHRHGNVVPRLVPFLAAGALIGAPLASGLALRLPQGVLARAFAVFLLANAAHTWLRSSRRK